jgi:hypothetical protein
MATIKTIRATEHRDIVTAVNAAKRQDIAIKGLENELKAKKLGVIASLRTLFNASLIAEVPDVVSNFKIESTRTAVQDGVEVEVSDGVVQCQMKVLRNELAAAEIALAAEAGPDVVAALTANSTVVDLVDTNRVLRYLVEHPAKVTITPAGDSLVIAFQGNAVGCDGVTFKNAVHPAEGFLDKVLALSTDRRTAAMGFINAVLNRMLSPTLVFGNRTATGVQA